MKKRYYDAVYSECFFSPDEVFEKIKEKGGDVGDFYSSRITTCEAVYIPLSKNNAAAITGWQLTYGLLGIEFAYSIEKDIVPHSFEGNCLEMLLLTLEDTVCSNKVACKLRRFGFKKFKDGYFTMMAQFKHHDKHTKTTVNDPFMTVVDIISDVTKTLIDIGLIITKEGIPTHNE